MNALTITITEDDRARLEEASKRLGLSPDDFALEALLDRLEEVGDAEAAKQRLAEIRSGAVQTVSHEEAMQSLGLVD